MVSRDFFYELKDCFNSGAVKEISLGIVVCGSGNDNKICVLIGGFAVGCGSEGELPLLMLGEVFLDIIVLYGTCPVIELFHLFGDYIHSGNVVVLREQYSKGKSDVACSCNGYLFSRDSHDLCRVLNKEVGVVKAQNIGQRKELVYRGAVIGGFEPCEHGSVYACLFGQGSL